MRDLIMTLNKTEEWEADDLREEAAQKRLNENQDEGYWDDELLQANVAQWEELDGRKKDTTWK